MKYRSILTLTISVISVIGIFSGCGGSNTPPAPLAAFQPEIVNVQDNFSFQATAVQNVTATLTYTWPNSGTRATINHSSVITGGSAAVTVYDVNDSLVYTKGLVASASEPSTTGIAGNWKIVVVLTNVSGTLNFSAQML